MDITVEYTAVIDGNPQAVWQLLAAFEDMHWHPQVNGSQLASGISGRVGAVRELSLTDGSTVTERLDELDHTRMTLTYSFQGDPPIPVSTSRTTISLQPADGQTAITWQGDYGVADSDAADLVTRVSREMVWPATAQALKTVLGR
ncbi:MULTISPECIES: SRPBCC family protein [Streptomyces]|uniref:SRPBCC family protein n=1 Tax=Streptomyces rhizosphaericus TaxID=114699 RepID=A0A6G4AH74_9ACTN|nr:MULTISPECIES: SRPBCC family protein [Streptomyces]NEW72693.1 SRPBCC family protein [Streptomyces rhizosphaericus]